MMEAIVWYGGADLRREMVPDPVPQTDHVVVDVTLAGVCGSDLHAIRGHHGPRRPPLILGHELVGTVAGREGRFVPFPLVVCGSCAACLRGEENLCATRGLIGLDRPGVFAERVLVREDALVAVPDRLADLEAVLTEPLATPLAALRAEDLPEGARIAVIGCGPIGLLAVHAARTLGLDVIAVEPVAERRRLAGDLGARETHSELGAIAGRGLDVVLDAVGIEATVAAGIDGVRRGGGVVILGLAAEVGQIPLADLVRRGIAVRGHYAYTRADFAAALRLLADHPIQADWATTVPLDASVDGIRRLVGHPEQVTKLILAVGDG
jgi:threonine dehydrogenase-like Zn-dependent dehydrogenase